MANGYAKEIQNRIGAAPDGTIFIVSDFADVADSETIRRNLNRLVQQAPWGICGGGPGCGCQSTGEMLSLDYRSLWRYRIKYAGAVYSGNGSMVLYQRRSI